MTEDFISLQNEWERRVGNDFIYEHLDTLLPSLGLKRINPGGSKDHWASPLKADLTLPRQKTREKTVIYPRDMHVREQGDWENGEWVLSRLAREMGLQNAYEVYRRVDSMYGLGMPKPSSTEAAQFLRAASTRSEILDVLKGYFKWNLANSADAKASKVRGYLKRRGFSQDAIESLEFGFVPTWGTVLRYMTQRRKFRKEDVDAACGVLNDQGRTSVGEKHILAIPYICGGVLKGFIFRRIDSSEPPKYIASNGLDRKSVFFNMPETSEDIVVVEGEIDALTAKANGIPSVVSIGGSDISSERRLQIADAFLRGVTRVFLCPDLDTVTDSDGNEVPNYAKRYKAVMRSVHTIKDEKMDFENIMVVRLPEPGDPDSFIREKGAAAFVELLRQAVPYWEYIGEYQKSVRQ